MRRLGLVAAIVAASGIAQEASAAGTPNSGIENAGVAVAIALPITAAGISLYKRDWQGVAQVTLLTGVTVGTAYLLKHFVHEERPDGSNDQSFPSDTAAVAFAPANYLWDRYGWQYGVPAYAAAAFVGYSRVEAKQHHWWDVAASAGMAWGYSRLITSRYIPFKGTYTGAYLTPHAAFLSLDVRF